MSEKIISILLIEDDKVACYKLSRCIEKFDVLKLIGITKNTSEGVSMVCSMLPDVVILDIELHSGTENGIMFLAELNASKPARRPYILITTNNSNPTTYDMIRHLGADFIMAKCKPDYSAQYVVDFLRMMQHTILNCRNSVVVELPEEDSWEKNKAMYIRRRNRELDLVGISPRNIGYHYLTDAILMVMKDPSVNVYKQLPKMIGKVIPVSKGQPCLAHFKH